MEKDYQTQEKIFLSTEVNSIEHDLLKRIKQAIDTLDKGQGPSEFNSWPIDSLIEARERMSRYSEPLGEFISEHELKSDFAYIWRKGAYAKDWQPLKDLFPKSTISDLESKLDSKYLDQQFFSMFHRRRADLLSRELDAVDRMIRTIDHRIRELERQLRLEHNPSEIII